MEKRNMKRTWRKLTGLFILSALAAFGIACAGGEGATGGGMTAIADKKVNESVTVTLSNPEGKLKNGKQEIMLAFTDGSGKPIEIKAASLNFNMPAMGTMAEMNDAATLKTTLTPGQFKGSVDLQMAGEWIAQISYEGTETGKTTMKLTAY